MAETVEPVANVAVAEQLVVRTLVKPDVGAEARLEIVDPVAGVLLIACEPVHFTVSISLVVLPIALVVVAAGVGHLAGAPFHAALPVSLVQRTVLVTELSVTMTHAVLPLADVLNAFLVVGVLSLAVSEAIQDFALILAPIGPEILAFASDLVLPKLSFVLGTVGPGEGALAVQ